MHRVRFQFWIPSVSLPFPFRYAGKVDSEKHACARISATSTCSSSVPLPTPFRYAGKLQGWQEYWDLSQSESMRIKAILEEDFSERHAQLDWDSCMGLHETHFFIWAMRVTSVLRRAWDEFKTSPKQVSVTSLNSSSVPLPFSFRYAGKVDASEIQLETFSCRCSFGIFL